MQKLQITQTQAIIENALTSWVRWWPEKRWNQATGLGTKIYATDPQDHAENTY